MSAHHCVPSCPCLYSQEWFDSSPERLLAITLDVSNEIAYWVRLQREDSGIAPALRKLAAT